MKKITTFGIVALAMVFMTSCRKDYTCTCTTTYFGGSSSSNITAKSTKKDAQAWCTAAQASNTTPGVSMACSVK